MQTIFLTFMGTTLYNKAIYHYDEENSYEGHFGTIALIKNKAKLNKVNRVFCVVTDQVVDKELMTPENHEDYPKREEKISPNNYEYFKRDALEIKKDGVAIIKSVDKLKIDFNSSGLELYNQINDNILSKIEQNERISLFVDTTNCFRSIPQTMFTVLKMIEKFNPNVKLLSINYWRTDKDYTNYYYMDLIDTFHNTQIAEDIGYFLDSFHISGFKDQFKEDNIPEIIKLLNAELESVEENLQYANVKKVCEHIRKALSLMNKALESKEDVGIDDVFMPYIKKISEVYNGIVDEDNTTMALNLAKELKERNQIQLAVTFLEATYNRTIVDIYHKRFPDVELQGNNEYDLVRYASIKIGTKYGKTKINKDDVKMQQVYSFYDQLADKKKVKNKIKNYVSKFLEIRNAMNHGNGEYNKDFDIVFDNFIKAIEFIKKEYN